jgi:saccharopine dehydrogenase-like NADP-dependent oxidoreductase
MTRILVLGGYGAVGREVAALAHHLPTASVIVAGRNPHTARPIPGTTRVRVDATDPGELTRALHGVDTVLMCAELDNPRVARACLERSIDYLDVSASHQVLVGIGELDYLARRNDATAVLSVGLAPGVTNLLARHCLEHSSTREARVSSTGSWPMRFPAPHGIRTVHRFPFSDQYTLSDALDAAVHTGLCLDSRLVTALPATAGRPAVAGLLRRPKIRKFLLTF